jgi:hypothetical protein
MSTGLAQPLSESVIQSTDLVTKASVPSVSESGKSKTVSACVLLTLIFLVLASWIRPTFGGDPLFYTEQAFAFLHKHGLAETRVFLEFGHLLWRPLAAVGAEVWMSVITGKAGIEARLAPLVILITLSLATTLICALLILRIAKSLSGSIRTATVVALWFLVTNPVLTYMRSGYSYLPGLAMQFVAVTLIIAPPAWLRTLRVRAFLIGFALAFSVCLWTPYIVSVPGLIIFAFIWKNNELPRSERMRLAGHTLLWTALITGAAFTSAILLNELRSIGQIAQWIRDSSHGWAQNHRLVRLTTGLPRSFIAVQDESLMLKRLFFHDPYAPVKWTQLLAAVAWKPPLFAAGMGALGWILARTAAGRQLLIGTLCCWISLIIFSVAVFEPSSAERFLPGFPLLFASLGYAAGRVSRADVASWVLGAFLTLTTVINLVSVAPGPANRHEENAAQRLSSFAKVCRPNTLLVLLSYADDIFRFQSVKPFDPLNRLTYHSFPAMVPGTLVGLRFREEFAQAALDTWQKNGDIWISQRLLATRPLPSWGWVEGDSPGIKWNELRDFYRQFQTDARTEGADGFLRIARNEANRRLLIALVNSSDNKTVNSY